jgi:hypothetical protein
MGKSRSTKFAMCVLNFAQVVASGPDLIKEIASMPDDKMSFLDATQEVGSFSSPCCEAFLFYITDWGL